MDVKPYNIHGMSIAEVRAQIIKGLENVPHLDVTKELLVEVLPPIDIMIENWRHNAIEPGHAREAVMQLCCQLLVNIIIITSKPHLDARCNVADRMLITINDTIHKAFQAREDQINGTRS